MGILSDYHLRNGYFSEIGGFPSGKIISTVEEYDGADHCCIACTQLQGRFPDHTCKRVLNDWIHFLKNNPTAFQALHFNSHVPQALFDAICCQKDLAELRLKWGNYSNLSSLTNLKKLQYLYLGSCTGIQDISPITELNELLVLYVENFKRLKDYTQLQKLTKLEQLVISGPILGTVAVQDIDFVLNMPNLASVWLPNVSITKRYRAEERQLLRSSGIHGVHGQQWWAL